jgi:multidrug efflux pump
VRIQVNPHALAAYGLSLEDVRTAINANVNQAKGSFDGPARASTIDANDQLRVGENTPTSSSPTSNGSPVRLRRRGHHRGRAENTASPGLGRTGGLSARRSSSTCSASPAPT